MPTNTLEKMLTFTERGVRKPQWGVRYASRCGHYALYHGDVIAGFTAAELKVTPCWHAQVWQRGTWHEIASCATREAAIQACIDHANGKKSSTSN